MDGTSRHVFLEKMIMTRTIRLLLLLLIAAVPMPAWLAAQAPAAPPDLDAYVARALKTFEVPGIALAIVKDDAVVVAKGYGVRKLGDPAPVDAKTLFGIASNTKIFTAVALGVLVEAGKIKWDDPVVNYLPWFQMWDPYVTRELTVRDLLVHRSGLGLGAGDLLWWPPSTYTRKEIARRLRYIRPATGFRSTYAYDNVLYLIAGELIEAVSGQSWEDFVSTRILAKVGMTTSSVRHSAATAGGNVAATHARIDGKVRPIAPFDSDNTNPAGGINSNAQDMAKWVGVLLKQGQLPDGSRLFGATTWRQLTTIVTPVPIGNVPLELAALRPNFSGYALGLGVRDYRGHKVLAHTGGLPGYVSRVLMIPEERLGIVVLTNQESSEAFDSIAYRVVDHYIGMPPADWIASFDKARAGRQTETLPADKKVPAAPAGKKVPAAKETISKPPLPLDRYAGTYVDEWYGEMVIANEKGILTIRFSKTPALTGDLVHSLHDTFIARWKDRELRADAYVTFGFRPDGNIEQIKMQAVSPETDFSFDFQDLLFRPVPRP
jgi:CubicO group peptidase (beta-lactamase class C family)